MKIDKNTMHACDLKDHVINPIKQIGFIRNMQRCFRNNNRLAKIANSLGPVYKSVCVSFTTGNLNCFRVK